MTADFAAAVDLTLIEGRALAESLMRDTCVVEFKTGRTEQDESSGAEVPVYEVRFTSKCKVQMTAARGDQGVDAGGRREVQSDVQVHLPWDAPQTYTDDRVRITAVGPRTPSRLVGATFYVGSDVPKSNGTATRLNVREAP